MLLKDLIGGRSKAELGLEFLEWCEKHIILDNGARFSLERRAALKEIYTDIAHPTISVLKGAQVGLSTWGIGFSLWLVDQKGKDAICYLPTDLFAKRFGATRFNPYINRSEYLRSRLQSTDQAGLKEINTHFLYILGLFNVSGAISIPSDCNLYDEVDVLNPENMEWAQDRISASELGWQRYFSVGMIPGEGIDERYQASDKRKWVVTCQACNKEQTIEDEFQENMVKKDGQVYLVCVKCGKPIDVENGCWIAEEPSRSAEHRGYRVPQLIIPGLKLEIIWRRWQNAKDKPSKRAKFNCSVLAKPDAGNLQPIDQEVINRATQALGYYMQSRSDEKTVMGIDVGDYCHLAIVQPLPSGLLKPLYFEEVLVDDLISRGVKLEEQFNVIKTVIDAMPYKTESKRLVRALKRSGWIQYFKGTSLQEKVESENEKAVPVITVDRDDSLDNTTDMFAENPPKFLLPLPRDQKDEETLQNVHRHLRKLVKEKKVTNSGDVVISYKRNVENHYGMALNSARIAATMVAGGGFGGIVSAGVRKIYSVLKGYE